MQSHHPVHIVLSTRTALF